MKRPLNVVYLLAAAAMAATTGSADLGRVVPSSLQNDEGNAGEASTFGSGSARIQQVYGTEYLTGLQVGDQITGISFRLDRGQFLGLPAQTVDDFSITLSTAKFGPNDLSMNFGDNLGLDAVTVRQGILTIGPDDYAGGGSPETFGATIAFSTSFSYQGGPLLVDISHSGFTAGGTLVDAHTGSGAQFLFGNRGSQTASGRVGDAGLVANLQVQAVPEPSTYLLLACGSAVLAWSRRLKGGDHGHRAP